MANDNARKPLDLEAIKARVDAANPGPWRVVRHEPSLTRMVVSDDHTLDIDFGYVGNCTAKAAEFVAHAREDVPALVAEVERLRAAEQRVRDLHDFEQYHDELSPWCAHCNRDDNERDDVVLWPCPTLLALDGGEPGA